MAESENVKPAPPQLGIAIGGPFDGHVFPVIPATTFRFDSGSPLETLYVQEGEADEEGRLIYRPLLP